MLKFYGSNGIIPLLGIGLSAKNCERLVKGIPLKFDAGEVVPGLTLEVLIIGGETEQQMANDIKSHMVIGAKVTVSGPAAAKRNPDLFAWLGEDEHGSGAVGLKQALVPAGCIPMVATTREKMSKQVIREQMLAQAMQYRKVIRLVRYVPVEEVLIISPEAAG